MHVHARVAMSAPIVEDGTAVDGEGHTGHSPETVLYGGLHLGT
jgi:hypothetical protein